MFKNNYISGDKIGELVFVNRAGFSGKKGHTRPLANFKCGHCGKEFITRIEHAKNLTTKSCGCVSFKLMTKHFIKHGHGSTGRISPEYSSWLCMWQRCTNPNHVNYPLYKDYPVSSEWKSFEVFLLDMGLKPTKAHTIDRVNNKLGYNKENCKWATKKEQGRNTALTTFIEYRGQRKSTADWAEEVGLTLATLYQRVFVSKWELDRAFTTKQRIK